MDTRILRRTIYPFPTYDVVPPMFRRFSDFRDHSGMARQLPFRL